MVHTKATYGGLSLGLWLRTGTHVHGRLSHSSHYIHLEVKEGVGKTFGKKPIYGKKNLKSDGKHVSPSAHK